MLVRFTKSSPAATADTLTCVRADGSTTTADLPRQGVLPRAAICFVVERSLGWRDASFGAIARAGRREPGRKAKPGEKINDTHGRQADALAECLEAGLWGGAPEPAAFAKALHAACARRAVKPPPLSAAQLERLRTALREFGAAWRPLPPGQSLERTF